MQSEYSLSGNFHEEFKKYMDSFKEIMGKKNENMSGTAKDEIKEWPDGCWDHDDKKDKHKECSKNEEKIDVKWDFSNWCDYPLVKEDAKKAIWTAFAAGLALSRQFCFCRNVNQNGVANTSNIGPKKQKPH